MRVLMRAELSTENVARRPAVWRLEWLTPVWCRIIFAGLLLFSLVAHWRYLTHDCPVDLSGDEAHYWDWSRHLDICYYSKGPMVAWLIRASCKLMGQETAAAVRMPAIFLAAGTSILTYWLSRRLFGSDRLALGAVLLTFSVPIFVAGSILMTIDPAFFFFWGLATCLTVIAVFDRKRWAWVALGLVLGLGFLAKFTMLLWLIGLFIFLASDREGRTMLRSPWPYLSVGIALLFTIPVLYWNSQHNWVSLRHVARDTGGREEWRWTGLPEFLGGQLAALGPALAVILVGAVVYALGRRRKIDPRERQIRYLAAIGMPLFVIVTIVSIWTNGAQPNWPAPAYFTLMILATYFLWTRMENKELWKPWRPWVWGTVAFGLLCMPLAHDTSLAYPAMDWIGKRVTKKGIAPRYWDPTFRLRGWQELGDAVSAQLRQMKPGTIIMGEDYQITAEGAFYTAGKPDTYYVGSWFADPKRRSRLSQYDVWEDRRLDQPGLVGRDAIYLGHEPPADFVAAFEKVQKLPEIEIVRRGVNVRTFRMWRCTGFKGMTRPEARNKF